MGLHFEFHIFIVLYRFYYKYLSRYKKCKNQIGRRNYSSWNVNQGNIWCNNIFSRFATRHEQLSRYSCNRGDCPILSHWTRTPKHIHLASAIQASHSRKSIFLPHTSVSFVKVISKMLTIWSQLRYTNAQWFPIIFMHSSFISKHSYSSIKMKCHSERTITSTKSLAILCAH